MLCHAVRSLLPVLMSGLVVNQGRHPTTTRISMVWLGRKLENERRDFDRSKILDGLHAASTFGSLLYQKLRS